MSQRHDADCARLGVGAELGQRRLRPNTSLTGVTSPLASPRALAAPPTAPPPPLPPRADGVPADMAFGAYQRGNFLYALLEAERRLDANPKDSAAMTLIGEIYRDGAAVAQSDQEASRWFRFASNLGDPARGL